jgi:hypothetical protein
MISKAYQKRIDKINYWLLTEWGQQFIFNIQHKGKLNGKEKELLKRLSKRS